MMLMMMMTMIIIIIIIIIAIIQREDHLPRAVTLSVITDGKRQSGAYLMIGTV
jgi:hypothetical protein